MGTKGIGRMLYDMLVIGYMLFSFFGAMIFYVKKDYTPFMGFAFTSLFLALMSETSVLLWLARGPLKEDFIGHNLEGEV